MKIAKNWYDSVVALRNKAAIKIQEGYKAYRRFKILPKLLMRRKINAIITVQKFMKGKLVHQKYRDILNFEKMKNTIEFFEKMKAKVQDAA